MLSFELRDESPESIQRFVSALKIVKCAASLGGVETIITFPAQTSHVDLSKAERERLGIRDGLIRVSVGIEDLGDLTREFDAALRRAAGSTRSAL